MRKSPRNCKKAPLRPILVGNAIERIAVGVLGPFTPSNNNRRYIVVFTDYLTSGWNESFAVSSIEASVIDHLLVDEVIARRDAPNVFLLSDKGNNFLSKLVAEVCKIFQIHEVNTSSYHPHTDGVDERFNSTLWQSLSMYVAKNQKDWKNIFHLFCLLIERLF